MSEAFAKSDSAEESFREKSNQSIIVLVTARVSRHYEFPLPWSEAWIAIFTKMQWYARDSAAWIGGSCENELNYISGPCITRLILRNFVDGTETIVIFALRKKRVIIRRDFNEKPIILQEFRDLNEQNVKLFNLLDSSI